MSLYEQNRPGTATPNPIYKPGQEAAARKSSSGGAASSNEQTSVEIKPENIIESEIKGINQVAIKGKGNESIQYKSGEQIITEQEYSEKREEELNPKPITVQVDYSAVKQYNEQMAAQGINNAKEYFEAIRNPPPETTTTSQTIPQTKNYPPRRIAPGETEPYNPKITIKDPNPYPSKVGSGAIINAAKPETKTKMTRPLASEINFQIESAQTKIQAAGEKEPIFKLLTIPEKYVYGMFIGARDIGVGAQATLKEVIKTKNPFRAIEMIGEGISSQAESIVTATASGDVPALVEEGGKIHAQILVSKGLKFGTGKIKGAIGKYGAAISEAESQIWIKEQSAPLKNPAFQQETFFNELGIRNANPPGRIPEPYLLIPPEYTEIGKNFEAGNKLQEITNPGTSKILEEGQNIPQIETKLQIPNKGQAKFKTDNAERQGTSLTTQEQAKSKSIFSDSETQRLQKIKNPAQERHIFDTIEELNQFMENLPEKKTSTKTQEIRSTSKENAELNSGNIIKELQPADFESKLYYKQPGNKPPELQTRLSIEEAPPSNIIRSPQEILELNKRSEQMKLGTDRGSRTNFFKDPERKAAEQIKKALIKEQEKIDAEYKEKLSAEADARNKNLIMSSQPIAAAGLILIEEAPKTWDIIKERYNLYKESQLKPTPGEIIIREAPGTKIRNPDFIPIASTRINNPTNTGNINGSTNIIKYDLANKNNIINQPRITIRPATRNKTDNSTRQIQSQGSIQSQEQSQSQEQTQIASQTQTQTQTQKNILRQPSISTTTNKNPEIITPFPKAKTPERKTREQGITIKVRRRGVFQNVGTEEDLSRAIAKGEGIVTGTAAASYKLERNGRTLTDFKTGRSFNPSKKERGVFIQKRSNRISSPGEKAEITRLGILTSKNKKSNRRKTSWKF